jgi:lysophospholipase L1-like esterase
MATPSPSTPAAGGLTKVVAIGDSFGTGFGLATPWPTRLQNALGVPVVNNSRNGRLTSEGAGLIDGLLDSEAPSHVVIMLGTNDAIRGSVGEATSNLQSMVNSAVSRNMTVVVATLTPITNSSAANDRAAAISGGIQGLNGARIADVRTGFNRSDIVDGVHPNDAGQAFITSVIQTQL